MLRFRPIMMTTFAAILGAVPLALSFGEGGEIRRPLGIAIVGGLIVSQMLTLYTTPVLYLYMDEFRLWAQSALARPVSRVLRRRRRIDRSEARARAADLRRRFLDFAGQTGQFPRSPTHDRLTMPPNSSSNMRPHASADKELSRF